MPFRVSPSSSPLFLHLLVLFAHSAQAFGAGNIASVSRIEGTNWRHGDIEDTLLSLLAARVMGGNKFSKMDVKRVYFGNWLRDYSQAVDVGTVKHVSAEAIRLLLWILAFISFGYGTGEFEVTADRLGCYRPEEHIDNPKDYADNVDAREYDTRLRGPVDEKTELSIDVRTGMKNYIASEDLAITTSAGLVRTLLRSCIQLARQYALSKKEAELYEALRLLGTACHCMEDFSAHSNYCELALLELGESTVFPHVGRRTQVQLPGARLPVYPIVTGTFGGVDFLHSVLGEFSDKTTQSEMQELEGTIQQSTRQDTSLLKRLLAQLPSGILGTSDAAGKADKLQEDAQVAQMQNMRISPKQPEAFTNQVNHLSEQIYPILEFHDNLMKHISEAIEKIPVIPQIIEQVQAQINMFVFSLIAPYILPIINQVKTELQTGSGEVIQSSKDKQLNVFYDDHSTDPTHSMLSKDHFSNVLNEPAGKVASRVLTWVVPQVIACWDDPSIDVERTIDRIINGIFHHPALRDFGEDGARDGRQAMFGVVEQWWHGMDERERIDLRLKLDRDGVLHGKNHKEGVHDSGHGCGKPLGMPNAHTASSSGAIGGYPVSAVMGNLTSTIATGTSHADGPYNSMLGDALGGGALGAATSMAGGGIPGAEHESSSYQSSGSSNPYQGLGMHQYHQQHPGAHGQVHGHHRHDDDDDSDGSHASEDDETRQRRRRRRQERMHARQERKEERAERREERRAERRPSASPGRRHSPEGRGRGGMRGAGRGRGGGMGQGSGRGGRGGRGRGEGGHHRDL